MNRPNVILLAIPTPIFRHLKYGKLYTTNATAGHAEHPEVQVYIVYYACLYLLSATRVCQSLPYHSPLLSDNCLSDNTK